MYARVLCHLFVVCLFLCLFAKGKRCTNFQFHIFLIEVKLRDEQTTENNKNKSINFTLTKNIQTSVLQIKNKSKTSLNTNQHLTPTFFVLDLKLRDCFLHCLRGLGVTAVAIA